jgi:pyruvate dehydrogenase E2 component (dihydrolipoamide acetyltransferase)
MQHNVILPDLGQTTDEVKVLKWLGKPGGWVSQGEPLLEVQTDKVDMEVEAFVSGYLREVLVEVGSTVAAFSAIAILTDTAEEPFERPSSAEGHPARTEVESAAREQSVRRKPVAAAPAARTLALELGLPLDAIPGTAPGGLITRADVRRYAERRESEPAGDFRALAAMATTVIRSKKEIPHFYASRDLIVSSAADWRRRWNEQHSGLHVTFNDLFVRCAAQALADVPQLNVACRDGAYEQRSGGDILLVVARDSRLELIPIRDPGRSPWEECLRDIKHAVAMWPSANPNPLLAVSNLGMYGIRQFAAIIPPGCTAVLAIGAVREEALAKDGQLRFEQVCTVTLSADHRVVDGIVAARFLDRMQTHVNSL